jgi:hypothetical protein
MSNLFVNCTGKQNVFDGFREIVPYCCISHSVEAFTTQQMGMIIRTFAAKPLAYDKCIKLEV